MTIPPPLRPGDAEAWRQLQHRRARGEEFTSKRAVHDAVGGKWDKITRLWEALRAPAAEVGADPVDAVADSISADPEPADRAGSTGHGAGERGRVSAVRASLAADSTEADRAEEVSAADPAAADVVGADLSDADPVGGADPALTSEVSAPVSVESFESERAGRDAVGAGDADRSADPARESVRESAMASLLSAVDSPAGRVGRPAGERNGKGFHGAALWSAPVSGTGNGGIVRETGRQVAGMAAPAATASVRAGEGAPAEGADRVAGGADLAEDSGVEEVSMTSAVSPAVDAGVSASPASADPADPAAADVAGADPAGADPALTSEVSAPVSADPVRGADRVRPGVLTVVAWAVGAAVLTAVVVRAVQTPIGQRVWGWLAGAVGADAVTLGAAAGGVGLLAAVVGVVMRVAARYRAARGQRPSTPTESRWFVVAAVAWMALSVDTTIRFFRQHLGIEHPLELGLVFAGTEVSLLACALAMRGAVRAGRDAPAARTIAWGIAALAGVAGLVLSGWPGGLIRAAGPAMAMVMVHLALGVELRHARPEEVEARRNAVARVLIELRERALSRLGLSDEGRSAVSRSRQRHARRAARLAMMPGELNAKAEAKRQRELQEALAKACVATDAEAARTFVAEVEVMQAMSSTDELVAVVRKLSAL